MLRSNYTISQISAPDRVNWRVDDFCASHGIGRTYFYGEVKRGQIKTFKVGKRTLVSNIEAKSWQSRKAEAIR